MPPIRIAAHGFGKGRSRRKLLLLPDYAVFVEAVLIPIRLLLNGSTIALIAVDTVSYHHIELPWHDVVLADGMPAETSLATGDRFNFANGSGPVRLSVGGIRVCAVDCHGAETRGGVHATHGVMPLPCNAPQCYGAPPSPLWHRDSSCSTMPPGDCADAES